MEVLRDGAMGMHRRPEGHLGTGSEVSLPIPLCLEPAHVGKDPGDPRPPFIPPQAPFPSWKEKRN